MGRPAISRRGLRGNRVDASLAGITANTRMRYSFEFQLSTCKVNRAPGLSRRLHPAVVQASRAQASASGPRVSQRCFLVFRERRTAFFLGSRESDMANVA